MSVRDALTNELLDRLIQQEPDNQDVGGAGIPVPGKPPVSLNPPPNYRQTIINAPRAPSQPALGPGAQGVTPGTSVVPSRAVPMGPAGSTGTVKMPGGPVPMPGAGPKFGPPGPGQVGGPYFGPIGPPPVAPFTPPGGLFGTAAGMGLAGGAARAGAGGLAGLAGLGIAGGLFGRGGDGKGDVLGSDIPLMDDVQPHAQQTEDYYADARAAIQNYAGQTNQIEMRYQSAVGELRELFQLAETPEEQAQLAFILSDLEEQKFAAQKVLDQVYSAAVEDAHARAGEIGTLAQQQGQQFGDLFTGAAATARENTAEVAGDYLGTGLGVGLGGAPQGALDVASLLEAAAPREQALAQQLGQIGADDVAYLGDVLGAEGGAQQGALQRAALQSRTGAIASHDQQVNDRIANERLAMAQALSQLQLEKMRQQGQGDDTQLQALLQLAGLEQGDRQFETGLMADYNVPIFGMPHDVSPIAQAAGLDANETASLNLVASRFRVGDDPRLDAAAIAAVNQWLLDPTNAKAAKKLREAGISTAEQILRMDTPTMPAQQQVAEPTLSVGEIAGNPGGWPAVLDQLFGQ